MTAVWTERRRSREKEKQRFADEYFLGSRSLSGVVLAMTLVATYGSVSSFVSGPGIAWKLGLGWVVFAAPQIIAGFFILGLLGKKMALASRASGAITVTGLLEVRFGSRALTVLLSLALLICFCAMMTGQFIGGAAIFAEAAGIDPVLGLLLFGLLTVFYTTFGGFRAVAWTDFVCAVLMIVGMVMLGWAVIGEAIDRNKADQIGMLATVMNCIYVSDICRYLGLKTEIFTPFVCGAFTSLYSKDAVEASFAQGKIVFFAGGTGHPYFSTDTATVLRAVEIEAEAILLAKAVDGIYDSDPKTNPNAVKYDEISIEEVVAKKLAAMDLTASIMCMEQKMPMLVFALDEKDSIINAVHGKFVGTKVTV